MGPTHYSHSWLLFSRLSCAFPHKAGICKSGGVGISFPKHLDAVTSQVTHVIMVPWRERAAASRGHTSGIPASACFIPRTWFYTRSSERGHAGGVPKASRRIFSFPSGNHGYVRNLKLFLLFFLFFGSTCVFFPCGFIILFWFLMKIL